METTEKDRLTIAVVSRSEADDRLDAGVEHLQRLASVGKTRGILVTRKGAGQYTVELSEAVPYGLTMQTSD